MPKLAIPQVVASDQAQGGLSYRQAGGADLRPLIAGAAAIGDASAKLAEANELRRLKLDEDEAMVAVQNAASAARVQWTEELENAKNGSPEGAPGFTAGVMKRYKEFEAKAIQAAPELGKKALQSQLLSLREQLNLKSFEFEMGAREKKVISDFAAGANADSQLIGADPSQLTDVLASRMALASSLSVTPAVRRQMIDGVRQSLPMVAGMRLAETDPLGTIRALEDPQAHKVFGLMSGEQLAHVRNVAEREIQRGGIEMRQSLESRAKDVQAMALNGGAIPPGFAPTPEQAMAAFGPRGAEWYRVNVGNYVDVGTDLVAMRVSTPAARAEIIAANEPKPGEGYAAKKHMQGILVEAARGIDRQLQEDPASYAAAVNPKIGQFASLMERVLNDKSMPAGDKAAAVDLYARTMLAEQVRLGAQTPRLLSRKQADGIAHQFMSVQQGGHTSADIVAGLEQTWGRHWPTVFAQLSADEKLPVEALVIPNMADQGARARLAMVSTMKRTEFDALLPEGDKKDVRVKLQEKFQDAASSFLTQGPAGAQTVAKIMGAAEKLAIFYKAGGKSAGDAAEQAFKETLGHAYTFSSTYRVPNAESPELVVDGAKPMLRVILEGDDFAPFVMRGLTPDEAKRQTMDAVKGTAEWVTADDESGLQLMARSKEGALHMVKRNDGRPYVVGWASLRAAAMDERTAQALSAVTGPRPIKPVEKR